MRSGSEGTEERGLGRGGGGGDVARVLRYWDLDCRALSECL